MKNAALVWSILGLLSSFAVSRAEVIVDNINGVRSHMAARSPMEVQPVVYDTHAQQFTLGAGMSYRIDSVTLPVFYNGGSVENSITVSIWDSRSLPPSAPTPGLPAPGNFLATLGSRTFSTDEAFESYETFTDFGDVTLSGDSFWVVVTQARPDLNSILWPKVNRHTSPTYNETGTGGLFYFGSGDPRSDAWSVSSMSTVGLMAVDGTQVVMPEPSTIALGVVGFGFLALMARRRKAVACNG